MASSKNKKPKLVANENVMIRVPVRYLVGAGHNPPSRGNDRDARGLSESFDRFGQVMPIVITPNYRIVEGHRRVAALKYGGGQCVKAIVTGHDPDALYAELNSTPKKHSGRDNLYIYFHNPDALTPGQRARTDRAREILGEDLLREMQKGGYSLSLYNTALRIARNTGKNGDFVVSAVRWMMKYSNVGQVYDILVPRKRQSLDKLVEAITKNKRLRTDITVDD